MLRASERLMIRNLAVDLISFMVVDGVFKQLLKEIPTHDNGGKQNLWLKEFYVLLLLSLLYLCFDHLPYLLFLLTSATYVFTQHRNLFTDPASCSNCATSSTCSCKIPGNISFRSPLARATGVPATSKARHTIATTPLKPFTSSEADGRTSLTPFESSKVD